MSSGTVHHCSFCGAKQSADTPLIAGLEGHICESRVSLAHRVVNSWGRRRTLAQPLKKPPLPREIKERLDGYVIGQDSAKETLSVAVYKHYKRLVAETENPRLTLDEDGRVEIEKSNILLLGPSGTGKTLLASTLARSFGVVGPENSCCLRSTVVAKAVDGRQSDHRVRFGWSHGSTVRCVRVLRPKR